MVAWMRLTGEDPLQLVRIREEFFGYADMNNGYLRLIVIDGGFERDFFAIADAILAAGGVFLDVGANHGLLSFGLAGRYADKIDFHLFEPNAALVASIEKSLPRYPLMRCKVNAVAISDHDGIVSFSVDEDHSGASHIVATGGETVPAITLDRYLDAARIRQVQLLKIDVEGYELVALRGARRSFENRAIQAVYFEYMAALLSRVQSPHELLDFLDSHDYQVCLCHSGDIASRGGATHTIRADLPGHGIPLVPVIGFSPPDQTDLLAIPRENLAPLAS